MTFPALNTKGFAVAVIDALSAHICVLDQDGVIIAVNRAWRNFGVENPPVSGRSEIGTHYLKVCQTAVGPGSEEAGPFALGVQSVLDRKAQSFQLEYPCHSPTELRWYVGRVTPLDIEQGGAVVSHQNITQRKLLEFDLARLAATDPLTGAPNRRYFFEKAKLEVARVKRFGASASVVMIDIDRFKAINDTHGHAVGDQALRSLAQTCQKALRAIDIFARFGGEEFILLLPETDLAGAWRVAEKLRLSLSDIPIELGEIKISLTASFGVAEVWPNDETIDGAIDRADTALYEAKHAGRNRVKTFTAPHRATGT